MCPTCEECPTCVRHVKTGRREGRHNAPNWGQGKETQTLERQAVQPKS